MPTFIFFSHAKQEGKIPKLECVSYYSYLTPKRAFVFVNAPRRTSVTVYASISKVRHPLRTSFGLVICLLSSVEREREREAVMRGYEWSGATSASTFSLEVDATDVCFEAKYSKNRNALRSWLATRTESLYPPPLLPPP